jgi:hypothetical protein
MWWRGESQARGDFAQKSYLRFRQGFYRGGPLGREQAQRVQRFVAAYPVFAPIHFLHWRLSNPSPTGARSSFNFIIPSLILVLTVPSGRPVRTASSMTEAREEGHFD